MTEPSRPPARATSLDELDRVLDALFTDESRQRGMAFRPRPTDLIVSPFAKCGTTWLQHIAHGLRAGGDLDFEEITVATPWIEVAHDLGWDLDAPQAAEPRVFKSHLSWHAVPKGARYLVSFRRPRDAFVSFYRFFEGFFFEPGALDLETVFRWRNPRDALGEHGYWHHLASWWERRHDDAVMLLCYEDMVRDPEGTVRAVARHMGLDPDPALVALVVRQSSREFMLEHRHLFDESPLRRRAARLGVLPFEVEGHKVTAGAGDADRYRLPAALERELDEIWAERIAPIHGLESYQALRDALRRPRSSEA